jgi:cysteine-rich repeat protein/predicted outer membrane repeat protein
MVQKRSTFILYINSVIRVGLFIAISVSAVGCSLIFSGDDVSFATNTDAAVVIDSGANTSMDWVYRRGGSDMRGTASSVKATIDTGVISDAKTETNTTDSPFDAEIVDARAEQEPIPDSAVDTGDVDIDDDAGGESTCGNGSIENDEACDDGNIVGGDGCSEDCESIESGFVCIESVNGKSICSACIIMVDHNATSNRQDGMIWLTAFKDLRMATERAATWIRDDRCFKTEIWVAAGTYVPTKDGRREAAFSLYNNVAIYGGFAGNESSRDQRDWQNNKTTLSGDLDGNDESDQDRSENSYHVIRCKDIDETAVLDGFWLVGGFADESMYYAATHHSGAGIYNDNSSPTLVNLIIYDNRASNGGGGMLNTNSSNPSLSNVYFMENRANDGGGMRNLFDSNPELRDVAFIRNSVQGGGGGMADMHNCNPRLDSVMFFANFAGGSGGGIDKQHIDYFNHEFIFIYNDGTSIYNNVKFLQNTATYGGGLSQGSDSRSVLRNVVFSKNHAEVGGAMHLSHTTSELSVVTFQANTASRTGETGDGETEFQEGGGIYASQSELEIENAFFISNTADDSGGGILSSWEGETRLINTLFAYNRAGEYGGGISITENGNVEFRNVTLSDNRADTAGGAIYSPSADSTLSLVNSIVWNNGTEIDVQGTIDVSYCAIDGGFDGTGNIDTGPIFGDPQITGTGIWTDVLYDESTGYTVLTDSSASWNPDELIDRFIRLNTDTEGGHLLALIEGNTETAIWIAGDFTEDVAVDYGYEFCDFRLHPSSPCIDAGNDEYAPEADGAGTERIDIPSIANCQTQGIAECDWYSDIGVFEYRDSSLD